MGPTSPIIHQQIELADTTAFQIRTEAIAPEDGFSRAPIMSILAACISRSEAAVRWKGDAINAGPVYRRTVPQSEVIAPAHLSNHSSLSLSLFFHGESASTCNMSCCMVDAQGGLYRPKRRVERHYSKNLPRESGFCFDSDIYSRSLLSM